MHPSSLDNMRKCYQRFIADTELERRSSVSVLDVGGADVNGTYRDLFRQPQFNYRAADLTPAAGVSIILDDPYHLPMADASVDIVLSGQMLEHCEFFWQSFAEMARVLAGGGCLFLIAPSGGPIHRYPVDCYRFYPDAYYALAKFAGCILVDFWLDERGPWNDLVGIFGRDRPPEKLAPPVHALRHQPSSKSAQFLDVFARIQEEFLPSAILEIQSDLSCENHASVVGIERSLIIIDDARSFEQSLNGFMHAERQANASSLVLVSDIVSEHAGDSWKLAEFLHTHRPDLTMGLIDGSLLIWHLDPGDRRLWSRYNPLVAQMQRSSLIKKQSLASILNININDFDWSELSRFPRNKRAHE